MLDLRIVLYYVVLPCLLWSIVLFLWRIYKGAKKNVKLGLACAILTPPLFVLYYRDLAPIGRSTLESTFEFLKAVPRGNPHFVAATWPAIAIGALYLLRMIEFWYLRIYPVGPEERDRREKNDAIVATLFSYTTTAIVLSGIISSALDLDGAGAAVLLTVFGLIYIGAIALLVGSFKLVLATARLSVLWMRRKAVGLIRIVNRIIVWIAKRKDLGNVILDDKIEKVNQAAQHQVDREKQDEEGASASIPVQKSAETRDSLRDANGSPEDSRPHSD